MVPLVEKSASGDHKNTRLPKKHWKALSEYFCWKNYDDKNIAQKRTCDFLEVLLFSIHPHTKHNKMWTSHYHKPTTLQLQGCID